MCCVTDSSSSTSTMSTSSSVTAPLTPSTHQKLSQAILDIFRSFGDVQRRLAIPRGTTTVVILLSSSPSAAEGGLLFCLYFCQTNFLEIGPVDVEIIGLTEIVKK